MDNNNRAVYVLGGLGVNQRVFENVDFGNFKPIFIQWIPPDNDESIEHYAKRLSLQIKDENPIIIGLSFGGMMAIEIAKLIKIDKLILLASAKTRAELPIYYSAFGRLNKTNFFPTKLMKQNNFITSWFFGIKTENQKKLLTQILKDTDSALLKWSLTKISNWQNDFVPENVVHIHGSADRILPIKYIKADKIIKDAGHFMTMTHSTQISTYLKEIIEY